MHRLGSKQHSQTRTLTALAQLTTLSSLGLLQNSADEMRATPSIALLALALLLGCGALLAVSAEGDAAASAVSRLRVRRSASGTHVSTGRRRTGSWSELSSDLESEMSAGLDEDALSSMERSVVTGQGAACLLQQPRSCDTSSSVLVHLDIKIDVGMASTTPSVGRLSLQLFNASVPATVANFLTICEGQHRGLSFKGNRFHRIISNFMAQGGDITRGDGRGGRSIYGEHFRDENFRCKHKCRGTVAMANAGPDTNGSQFFITFSPTAWLDGKHVVFGQLIDGWSTLAQMESYGSEEGKPSAEITIAQCSIQGANGRMEPFGQQRGGP